MKSIGISQVFATSLALWMASAGANPGAHLEQAASHGSRASNATSGSALHSLAATGQVVSGVLAAPILASGMVAVGVGSVATQAGASLMNIDAYPADKPFPLADETISIMAPDQALKNQAAGTN